MKAKCQNLTEVQRNEFLKLLQKTKEFFYEILGIWKKIYWNYN